MAGLWLFFVADDGCVPAGNDGAMHMNGRPRPWNVARYAASWRAGRAGNVYTLNEYTQHMCEMDSDELGQYVTIHGRKVV